TRKMIYENPSRLAGIPSGLRARVAAEPLHRAHTRLSRMQFFRLAGNLLRCHHARPFAPRTSGILDEASGRTNDLARPAAQTANAEQAHRKHARFFELLERASSGHGLVAGGTGLRQRAAVAAHRAAARADPRSVAPHPDHRRPGLARPGHAGAALLDGHPGRGTVGSG